MIEAQPTEFPRVLEELAAHDYDRALANGVTLLLRQNQLCDFNDLLFNLMPKL